MARNAGELAAVLAALAPVLSSWRVPYLNRGDFEGEDVVVGCGVLRRARGSRYGDQYGVQWQAWRHPVPACSTASELS
jgi:hypothetical protein